jgi:hypothetical protein
MCWLASRGATVAIPVGHSPDYDVLADFGERIVRVQVKTSSHYRNGRWEVRISTMGGNRSWTGLVKRFHPSRCDRLFAHVGDGRRWFIPSHAVQAESAIKLGGAKYSEFEVEPGEPLPARITPPAVAQS